MNHVSLTDGLNSLCNSNGFSQKFYEIPRIAYSTFVWHCMAMVWPEDMKGKPHWKDDKSLRFQGGIQISRKRDIQQQQMAEVDAVWPPCFLRWHMQLHLPVESQYTSYRSDLAAGVTPTSLWKARFLLEAEGIILDFLTPWKSDLGGSAKSLVCTVFPATYGSDFSIFSAHNHNRQRFELWPTKQDISSA